MRVDREDVGFGIQVLVGTALIVFLAAQIRWSRVFDLFESMTAVTVSTLLVLTVVGTIARFGTWYALLRSVTPVSYTTAGEIDLLVNFINQLLPSRISGLSIAPLVISTRCGVEWTKAVALVALHTGLYAVLYGMVAAIGLAIWIVEFPAAVAAMVGLSTGVYLTVGVITLSMGSSARRTAKLLGVVRRIVESVPLVGPRIESLLGDESAFADASATTFRATLSNPRTIGSYTLGWAVALLVIPGLRVWLLLSVFGAHVSSPLLLPILVVSAYSVTILPITPGGIGITEATATLVLEAFGVGSTVAIAVVFVDRVLGTYLPALLGWYPFVRVDIDDLLSKQG